MVLENAKSSPDPYGDNSSSQQTPDPFSYSDDTNNDSNDRRATLTIDVSTFPGAMPIMGPLLGYTQASMHKHVYNFVSGISRVADRPLTPEEAQAVAWHGNKMRVIQSYGDGTGVLVGLARAFATRENYKFPFRKAAATFNPDILGPLKGQAARVGWTLMRYTSYGLLGNIFLGLFAQLYSVPVMAVGVKVDPRLKSLNESIERTKTASASSLRNTAPQRRSLGQLPPLPGQEPQQGFDVSGGEDWKAGGGDAGDRERNSSYRIGAITGDALRQPFPQRGQGGQQPQPQPSHSTSTSTSSYDPDSPTGGFGPLEPSSSASSDSGSAWDRVRRGASGSDQDGQSSHQQHSREQRRAPHGKAPSHKEQRDGSPFDDSFGFGGSTSSTEAAKRASRSEEQRKFDASLDRERNGGDFEDSGKRW